MVVGIIIVALFAAAIGFGYAATRSEEKNKYEAAQALTALEVVALLSDVILVVAWLGQYFGGR